MAPITPPIISLQSILPEIVVVVTALLVLFLDLALAKGKKTPLAYLSLLGLAISFIVSAFMW